MSFTGPNSNYRRDGGERRDDPEDHQHPLVLILRPRLALLGEASRVGSMTMCRNQEEERPGADVPGNEEPRRFADVDSKLQRDIGRDQQGRPRQQTRSMGEGREETAGGLASFWLGGGCGGGRLAMRKPFEFGRGMCLAQAARRVKRSTLAALIAYPQSVRC